MDAIKHFHSNFKYRKFQQLIQHRILGRLVNNESERMWKEANVSQLEKFTH